MSVKMSRIAISRVALLRLSSRSSSCASSRTFEVPCRNLPFLRTSTLQCPSYITRYFSITAQLQKKAGKANKAHARTDSTPPVDKVGEPTPTDEAYDVSGLEAQILKALEKLTHELGQLRSGGRLNPDIVESLKVQLGTASHGKESVRLGDIAQVVPRGRVLNVICGEEAHIKPITTAIAASPHSLTPLAPESSNPLMVQVPLPPPTGESRRAAIEEAVKASERADKVIQQARQDHNKKLRQYGLNREVLPDDLQKAKKQMEEVVKKGHAEVKRIADGAKKVLESQ
ncbi:ribosome recycling factor [Pyrenophora seminiperda CCB06]|uniref:Ribosome recycling factor n=1 Tax=Pyrenophora seminiperda CCB06 TaxID=1302712 RepID=A0A3M7MKP7_9PLEO|nr:ribosome recycling factor [Pyrenophora seminiperda CCB06]